MPRSVEYNRSGDCPSGSFGFREKDGSKSAALPRMIEMANTVLPRRASVKCKQGADPKMLGVSVSCAPHFEQWWFKVVSNSRFTRIYAASV
jgi:hypothetical protein